MAGGRDRENTKGMAWVDMKDSKGNIVKDGKGNAVKTRKFLGNEKPKARPAQVAKAPAPAAKKAAPKLAVTAKAAGGAGAGAKASAGSARSGAARSTAGKVQEVPVPGRAIWIGIKNAFSGKGETDAAKISASGNPRLRKKP